MSSVNQMATSTPSPSDDRVPFHAHNAAIACVLAGGAIGKALDLLAESLTGLGGVHSRCLIQVLSQNNTMHVSQSGAGQIEAAYEMERVRLQETPGAVVLQFPPAADPMDSVSSITTEGLRVLSQGYRAVMRAPVGPNGAACKGSVTLHLPQMPSEPHPLIGEINRIAELVALLSDMEHAARHAEKTDRSLASLSASIPGVVYQRAVHPDGEIRYTYISENAEDLFGVTSERILNDPEALFRHYSPEYRQSFRQKLLKASEEMTLWDVEATILRPDGETRYTHAIARPQREDDGSVLWTGVILDATRIKEAELAAAAAEVRTRDAIVESLSQGLLLFDRNDRLTVRNSHFLALYPEMGAIAVPGAEYTDILKTELDADLNPRVINFDANDELIDRLLRHGEDHLVYERAMADDRHILINEYRTAEQETVVLYTDITEMKRRERKIEHLAHHDALTGLANRILFQDRLSGLLDIADHEQKTVAVVCLDLDRFKTVNDTLGHQIGDVLLKQVAARIQGCIRESDIACRLGGDEFAVIVSDVVNGEMLTSLAWRLLHEMAQPFKLMGHTVVSGTSIGIALSGPDSCDPETILRNADLALYRAKSDGRGTFRFFESEMDMKAQSRRLMEMHLRSAVAANELEVHYQPLVDAHTSQIIGAEALLRWNRQGQGYVPPLEFVPLAEETGLIAEIGLWVLKTACRDAATWPSDIRIAVNISPAQLRNSEFAAIVKDIIRTAGLDPNRLELEITESMLLRNTETNLSILRELKAFGIRISMDDFGTGYSSLGNLRSFPFDKIKIDKSFISDLNKSVDAAAIIRAVLALGRSLGMTTTAEGVETRDQLAYLRAEGCVEIQGHYFAKALTTGNLISLLSTGDTRIAQRTGQSETRALTHGGVH